MNWNDVSLKTKLIGLFLILSLVPLTILGLLAYNDASSALENQAFNQLTSVREAKGRQIEDYFQQINDQITTFSQDHMITDFAKDLKEAFWEIDQGITDSEYKIMESSVRKYYEKEFIPRLNKNIGESKSISPYWPKDRETIIMQYYYLSNNPNPTGEKHKLDDAKDGSRYSKIHSTDHPVIREYLEKFGYYDIFIADPDTGHIYYTVFKEIDYTTSLLSGPYKDTNFATAFKKAAAAGKRGDRDFVAIEDFEPYDPSYNAPASFTASPIFSDDGEFIAVLLFQMPVDNINNIMTGNEGWEADGLGASGETYLVGSDYMMKSISRFYLQDKPGMFEALNDINYNSNLINQMDRIGTTIGLMEVQTEASKSALKGDVKTEIIDDYRGIPVLSSYRKLNIAGLDWVLLSEIDEAEAFAPVYSLRNKVLLVILIVIISVIFASYLISQSILRSIKNTIDMLKDIAEGEGDLTKRLETSKDEVGVMSMWFNKLIDNIESMIVTIKKNVEKTSATSLKLSESSKEANNSTQQVSSTVQEIAKGSQSLSKSANDSKKETEQLISSIKLIADSANKSANDATEVYDVAVKSSEYAKTAEDNIKSISETVKSSTVTVQQLGEKSKEINKIIEVINSISEQTNLLALNAAIEAARAGEAGKGFAVVADEVRKLAEESQKATKQIESMVNEISSTTTQAVESMENGSNQVTQGSEVITQALSSLNIVSEKVQGIVGQIKSISSSTQAQLESSSSVQKMINDVSAVAEESATSSEEVSASIEETTSSIQFVANSAEELNKLSDELKEQINKFKVRNS